MQSVKCVVKIYFTAAFLYVLVYVFQVRRNLHNLTFIRINAIIIAIVSIVSYNASKNTHYYIKYIKVQKK